MEQRFPLLLIGAVSALLFLGASTLAQDFHGCPVEGRGGDPALNRLKNRTAGPECLGVPVPRRGFLKFHVTPFS